MKIGIYGGTFSPPHLGHVRAAEAFICEMGLDKLLVIPAFLPPHKSEDEHIAPALRLAMCRLTFRMDRAEVSPMELCRGGRSYTVETLEILKRRYPDDELYLLCGTDMILSFDTWYRAADIFRLCTVVYIRREDDDKKEREIDKKIAFYVKQFDAEIRHIKAKPLEISSTEIRRRIKEGKSLSGFVTPAAERFILDYKLYTEGTKSMIDDEKLSELRDALRGKMSCQRYNHTLGVEKMAVRLGELLAPDKIPILRGAALLHDITKENSFEKQLQICENVGIIITYVQKMTPKTLHALTAAALIPSEYPDFAYDEIISAVKSHTTGSENMSVTDEIIYLADWIEENRTFEGCVILRNYFWDAEPQKMSKRELSMHLKKTLLLSFDKTIKELTDEGLPIDINTAKARNSLLFQISQAEEHPQNGK